MTYLTDTHCHLDFSAFDADRQEVIARAKSAGLKWILNPGIDLPTSKAALQLAEAYPVFISAAIGFHPNLGKPWQISNLDELRSLAAHPSVCAIGEIGLDYYRQHTSPEQQRLMFTSQLELAQQLELPVIIHNRTATADLMSILTSWYQDIPSSSRLKEYPGVFHSFSADLATALSAIKMNFHIGISGPITFKNAHERKDIVAQLPVDKLLLETDAPFLTPHPHRGRRNEPAYIPLIAEEIAHLQSMSLSDLAKTTYENAQRLFSFPPINP